MKRTSIVVMASSLALSLSGVSMAKDKEDAASEIANAKKGLAAAKISLVDAIHSAMKKVPGGKVVQAELEVENGEAEFEVEIVAADGKHMEIDVDAVTGTAGDAVEEKQTSETNSDDEKAEDAAAKAKVTLLQAIDAAQKRVPGGKAYEASSEMEKGNLIFTIEFLAGDKIMDVQVDPSTGKVISVEEED